MAISQQSANLPSGSYTVNLESYNLLSELADETTLHKDALTIQLCDSLPISETKTPLSLTIGPEVTFSPSSSATLSSFDLCKDAEAQIVMSPSLSDFMTCTATSCAYDGSLASASLALPGSGPHSVTQTLQAFGKSSEIVLPLLFYSPCIFSETLSTISIYKGIEQSFAMPPITEGSFPVNTVEITAGVAKTDFSYL